MFKVYKSVLKKVLIILIIAISYSQVCVTAVDRTTNVDKYLVDKSIKEQNRYIKIDVSYPQVINLPNSNMINNSIEQSIYSVIDELKGIIKEYYGNGELAPTIPYEIVVKYYVTNTDDILSFYYDIYQYAGGAHGGTTRYSYNINKKTGENLSLDKLFNDSNYKSIIDSEIKNQIEDKKDEYFYGKDGFNGVNEKTKYYVMDEYIVVYYQQYEIAPYATGIPEFKIKFKNL